MSRRQEHLPRYLFRRRYFGIMMAMRRPTTLILVVAMLCSISTAYAQEQDDSAASPPAGKKKSSGLLRRNVVISLATVRRFFPGLTRQLAADGDADAFGKPAATLRVIYSSTDRTQKLTISVDDYPYGSQALLAYQQAAAKTQPSDFESIAIASVGQQVFGGTMRQDSATQIMITSSDDNVLMTVTLSGYEATTDNIAKLADLARLQVAEARARLKR